LRISAVTLSQARVAFRHARRTGEFAGLKGDDRFGEAILGAKF